MNRKLPGHPVLSPIAGRHGVSAHAVVLAWLLALSPAVIPIPGARTVEHATDSAGAAGLVLDPDEVEQVSAGVFSRA